MLDYLPIVWVAIIVVSIVCEAASRTFIPLWFAPAAAVSLILSFAGLPKWLGVLAFFFTALVLFVLSRTVFASLLGIKKRRENPIAGRQALVIESVDNLRMTGKVLVDGVEMRAVSLSDSDIIPAGEIVTVIADENGVIVCK